MSYSQWLNWCSSAADSSIDELLDRFTILYSSVAFVSLIVCVASLTLSVLYFRLPLERKSLLWPQYGWFVGLICASSFICSLAWGSARGFAGYAYIDVANISA
jgi:hypothetical protein